MSSLECVRCGGVVGEGSHLEVDSGNRYCSIKCALDMGPFTCSRCGETFEGEQRFIIGRDVYCSLPCYTNTPSDLEKKPSKNDLGDLPEKSGKILDDENFEETE